NATMKVGGGWVLEIDIRHFFDSIGHGHLRAILDQRVRDGVIRRTIDKWLNAGVQHDGAIRYPDGGTPQGGVMTPPTPSQTSSTSTWSSSARGVSGPDERIAALPET